MLTRRQLLSLIGLVFFAIISNISLLIFDNALEKISPQFEKQYETKESKNEEIPIERKEFATVTNIVDGDTIKAQVEEEEITIRIAGIDTPETNNPNVEKECYGDEATNKLIEKLTIDSQIELIKDTEQSDKDRYGRLIRYVYKDGQDIGASLIRDGYAEAYKEVSVEKGAEYEILESEAKFNKLGMWGSCIATE